MEAFLSAPRQPALLHFKLLKTSVRGPMLGGTKSVSAACRGIRRSTALTIGLYSWVFWRLPLIHAGLSNIW